MTDKIKIVILAGGKGKRMESDIPKGLTPLRGKHLLGHLLESVAEISKEKPVVVIGHMAEQVKSELGDTCIYVLQKEQLGTGHALACAEKILRDAEHVLVLQGDMPFLTSETIKKITGQHLGSGAKITFATALLPDFSDWRKAFLNFGRILRENGEVVSIREYKDGSDAEKEIKEVNAGCYIFNADWLWKNLKKIKNDNAQKEYYLTDLLHIAFEEKEKIKTVPIDPREALGVNTKEELEILEKLMIQ